MNKFKKWCNDHTIEILLYGLVGVSIGLGVYMGYQWGVNVGFDKGFKQGDYFNTWKLIQNFKLADMAERIVKSGHGITLEMFSTMDVNPDDVDPEIMKVLAEHGYPMDMGFYDSVRIGVVAIKPD